MENALSFNIAGADDQDEKPSLQRSSECLKTTRAKNGLICLYIYIYIYKSKAVPLHAMEALGGEEV
jgi:hypothetical protein